MIVQSSCLPECTNLTDAIDIIGEMTEDVFQTAVGESRMRKLNHKHTAFLTAQQQPWSRICSSVADLEALQLVAQAVSYSDSGFLLLETAQEIVQSVFFEHSLTCSWAAKPCFLVEKLLRYLPIIVLGLNQSVSGEKQIMSIAARPSDGSQFLQQIVTLATTVNQAATRTQETLRDLPIHDYLLVMETERDRRVFKGLVVAVTNKTFVRQAFGWERGSIAKISEDLGVVDCFVADFHGMLRSIEYHGTTSSAQRKRMRHESLLQLAVNGFLGSKKRGGRPSKIRQFE
jgi:hypothetical protein